MALVRSTDPLVWIDCEMTGLDPSIDTIMSISCIITNADLHPLDATGFNAIIHHTPAQLSHMSEWCVQTHGASGLTQSCLSPSTSTTASAASASLLAYIKHHVPEPRRALLAGNSIHADRSFLVMAPWTPILEHLHYRLFDVSAMKEMVRRWAPMEVLENAPRKQLKHTAHEDVLESLQEAMYYKGLVETMDLSSAPLYGPRSKDAVNSVLDGGHKTGVGVSVGAVGESVIVSNGPFTTPMPTSTSSIPPPIAAIPTPSSASILIQRPEADLAQHNDEVEGFRTDVP